MNVARIWVTIDYFHPYLGYQDIQWDKALTSALPGIRSAKSAGETVAALNGMLATLHDPLTVAFAGEPPRQEESEPEQPQRFRFHRGIAPEGSRSATFFSGFTTRNGPSPTGTTSLDVGDGVTVQIRLSEAANANHASANGRQRLYLDDEYPPEEGRILALFRLWGAVRYFFACKDLMDEDWDATAAEYLPKLMSAKDAREYQLAIAELISHLSDSNAAAESSVLDDYFGVAAPNVRVRLVEKKAMITSVGGDAASHGAKVGDLVSEVDGEGVVDRIKREANFLSASTPAGLGDMVARRLLNGSKDKPAQVTVTRAGELPMKIELPRAITNGMRERPESQPIQMLPGEIAYVNVEQLQATTTDLFSQVSSSKAIVFDFRGKCDASPAIFAAGFPGGAGKQSNIVTGPLALQPDASINGRETSTASYFEIMTVPRVESKDQPYQGKVVVALIDERTTGGAERAVLQLAAATHLVTVGMPSAGAPGEAGGLRLPGKIRCSFSGQDLRLTNGGQVQRQGIQPTLAVPMTITGVRAGRDEALQKAIQGIREELGVVH